MPAKEWRICAQLYELFAELDAARGPAQGHGGNYVGQAVNYIKSNYSQPMRVQDIAAGLGLNRSYFAGSSGSRRAFLRKSTSCPAVWQKRRSS